MTYIRIRGTSREATREEEGRLHQAVRLALYEITPAPDTGSENLDIDRIEYYLHHVLKCSAPDLADSEGWRQLLLDSDLLTTVGSRVCVSVARLLLFDENPNRCLPPAGVTAVAFPGAEKEYNTVDEERIRGLSVSTDSPRSSVFEKGAIDCTVDFVVRNLGSVAWLEGSHRRRKKALPVDAAREAAVNAVALRNYGYIEHYGMGEHHQVDAKPQRPGPESRRARGPLHRPAVEGTMPSMSGQWTHDGTGTVCMFVLMPRVARLLQGDVAANRMLVCTFTRTADLCRKGTLTSLDQYELPAWSKATQ